MAKITDYELCKRIGLRMCARRQWLQLTQAEIGKRAGITHQAVAKYETGRSGMGIVALLYLSRALECTTTYLLGEDAANLHVNRKESEEVTKLFSCPYVAGIIAELRTMGKPKRRLAWALVKAAKKEKGLSEKANP